LAAEMIAWGTPQAKDTELGIPFTFDQERDMPTWVTCAVHVQVAKKSLLAINTSPMHFR